MGSRMVVIRMDDLGLMDGCAHALSTTFLKYLRKMKKLSHLS